MIDGIKLLDVSVSSDALLQHPRLLFPLALDEQTGTILDRPRRATTQGLTFTLITALKGDTLRCELTGSLHRYANEGRHNADDFAVAQLLTSLDELVTIYGIDPFASRLNNIEFGVNLQLPFPVRRVLANLISYKYRPFTKEAGEGFAYYQCHTQRYVVKLYDKGAQYRGLVPSLPANVLRVEIKVLKMEYLTRQGIELVWLVDLLQPGYYDRLGDLLVNTFTEILFDEPTINPDRLNARQRDTYQNGRNPRYWTVPEGLSTPELGRTWKRLQRVECRFRSLLDTFREGIDWQRQTAMLIGQTWKRLTAVDEALQATILEQLAKWKSGNGTKVSAGKCPKLTGCEDIYTNKMCPLLTGYNSANNSKMCPLLTDSTRPLPSRETSTEPVKKCPLLTGCVSGKVSSINRLSVGLKVDIADTVSRVPYLARGTPLSGLYWG